MGGGSPAVGPRKGVDHTLEAVVVPAADLFLLHIKEKENHIHSQQKGRIRAAILPSPW